MLLHQSIWADRRPRSLILKDRSPMVEPLNLFHLAHFKKVIKTILKLEYLGIYSGYSLSQHSWYLYRAITHREDRTQFQDFCCKHEASRMEPDPAIRPQICQWRIKDRRDGTKRKEVGVLIFGAESLPWALPVTEDALRCSFFPMEASSETGYAQSLSSWNSEPSTLWKFFLKYNLCQSAFFFHRKEVVMIILQLADKGKCCYLWYLHLFKAMWHLD